MSVKANNPELSLTPGQSPHWWEIVRETMLKCHSNCDKLSDVFQFQKSRRKHLW